MIKRINYLAKNHPTISAKKPTRLKIVHTPNLIFDNFYDLIEWIRIYLKNQRLLAFGEQNVW